MNEEIKQKMIELIEADDPGWLPDEIDRELYKFEKYVSYYEQAKLEVEMKNL